MNNNEFAGGLLGVNKHSGVTSHDIVNKIRRLFSTRQVGHTGTLDPMAEGVLPVLVGRAVKAADLLPDHNKAYAAVLKFGVTSDTEDITGTLTYTDKPIPGEEDVYSALEAFTGKIKQIPPMYSAVKIDGKTLMERARAGEVIEREARDIEIFSLSASKIADDEYNLLCSCSKGTYIRTLCADIGAALGCGGVMAKLTRTEACGIALSDTKTITELEEMNESDRMSLLIPAESIFNSLEKVKLPEFYTRLAKNGAEIYLSKIGCSISVRERVTLYTNNGEFFAIGEVREYKEGLAVKPIKFL